MNRRDWIISVVSGVVLGLLALVYAMHGPGFVVAASAQGDADVQQILNEVLSSHTRWVSLKGEAEIVWYGPSDQIQRYVEDVAFAMPASARIELVDSQGVEASQLWVSDGEQVFDVSPESKTFTTAALPAFARDTSLLPASLTDVSADVIYPHPMALLVPSPVAEYVFPHWFAQGAGRYELKGEENVLGRLAWLVAYANGEDSLMACIDQQTGIILRFDQQLEGKPLVHFEFLSLEINGSVGEDTFTAPDGFDQVQADN